MGRKLRLLHCDDVYGKSHYSEDDREPIRPHPFVERISIKSGGSRVSLIKDWHSACLFWIGFRAEDPESVPDLIVSDILFKSDSSTPLSMIDEFHEEKVIPTGLSHVKALAAMARGRSRPVGVAIHTKNPNLWPQIWQERHPLGAYAAHEIGELAAILDEMIIEGESPEDDARECFRWLGQRTRDSFELAFPLALSDYRKRLVTSMRIGTAVAPTMVPPETWTKLMAWVDGARSGDGGSAAEQTVPLIYPDGSRDEILMTSLFADAYLDGHDPARAWPPQCFDYSSGEIHLDAAISLDDNGWPRFGRFIYSLGETERLYDEACRQVRQFPVTIASDEAIGTCLTEIAGAARAEAGLTVLLQRVRLEYERYCLWRDAIESKPWDARKVSFSPEQTERSTLAKQLRSLSMLCADIAEPFHAADVIENRQWPLDGRPAASNETEKTWIRWHFTRLIESGALKYVGTDEYVRTGRFDPASVPAPERLPAGTSDVPTGDPVTELCRTLGYSRENYNQYIRYVGSLMGGKTTNARKELGRATFDAIMAGSGPLWIHTLMQEFARHELDWKEGLPLWISGRLGPQP